MAEEKKTSTKADAKSEKTAKAAKSKDKKKSKKNPFKSIASFFKSVKAEGKKVVWAPAKDVLKNTIIVLVVVIIAGLAIYGVDSLLSLGMTPKSVRGMFLLETAFISGISAFAGCLLGGIIVSIFNKLLLFRNIIF